VEAWGFSPTDKCTTVFGFSRGVFLGLSEISPALQRRGNQARKARSALPKALLLCDINQFGATTFPAYLCATLPFPRPTFRKYPRHRHALDALRYYPPTFRPSAETGLFAL
jgi:hypothetical protein